MWSLNPSWRQRSQAPHPKAAPRPAQVPPGVLLDWRENMLLVKATQEKKAGWMLIGMLQFDQQVSPVGRGGPWGLCRSTWGSGFRGAIQGSPQARVPCWPALAPCSAST